MAVSIALVRKALNVYVIQESHDEVRILGEPNWLCASISLG